MQVNVAQIKKLRGKSLREIRTRGKQEIAKLNERLLGYRTAEMSDPALLREIDSFHSHNSVEGIGALILERIRVSMAPEIYGQDVPVLLPSLLYREEIASLIFNSFPKEYEAIINRANQAIAGRFDLLGFHNISFGVPIDWRFEPISGKRTGLEHWSQIDYLNPQVAGDKKLTWELNRHGHFVTLGQAYLLTGDERFAEAFVSQASSWMDANPPNRGINWTSSLELALRSISWLWALHLCAESRHLSSKFVMRMLKFLVAHGHHIESYLSHYFSPNTHLTGEALGLFYLGTALPELSRANLWRKTGLEVLLAQLPLHIRADGVYFEQSSYYHRYTTDFYIHLLALAKGGNWSLSTEVREKLSMALEYLMWITRPDGTSPLIGDDDGGRLLKLSDRASNDFRDTLATGAALFGRGDWKFIAGEATVETLWLLGPEWLDRYNQIEVTSPDKQARAFADSGYYVMRDGWWRDSSYVLMDCGPHGVYNCGHAHADALAFEFAARGTTWLVDPGTFTYTADAEMRDWFRHTRAHNTATVDGLSQSEPAGTFSWNQVAAAKAQTIITEESFACFEGTHNGYQRLPDPVTHTRTLLFLKQESADLLPAYLLVRDHFAARSSHDYNIYYHFPATCSAVASDNQIRVSNQNGQKLTIHAFHQQTPKVSLEQGWTSQIYGNRQATTVGVIEVSGEREQEIMSFILPFSAKEKGARVERQQTDVRGSGAFIVTLGEARDVVVAGNGTNRVECQGLSAIASMAWARFAGRRLVRACLVKGKELQVAGSIRLQSTQIINHCVIQLHADNLEISIEGARSFTLKIPNPLQKIILCGTSFMLNAGQRNVSFINDAGQWRVTESVL